MANGGPEPNRSTASAYFGLPRELVQRIASGAGIGFVALTMLYWGPNVFLALIFFVAAAMSWEWGRIVRGGSGDAGTVVHVIAVLAAAILSALDMAGVGILACAIGAIAVAALTFGKGRAPISAVGVLYTGLPVIALGWLRGDEPLGFLATLYVILMVVVTDTAAYFAGRSIGGPKLWPAVSPNKTWSGLGGGLIAAAIAGALFAYLSGSGSALWLATLGLFMGGVAQGGDLAESALKRHFGVKDASDLIPGHGGFMDRMDGLVTASVFAAVTSLCIDAQAPARALLYGS